MSDAAPSAFILTILPIAAAVFVFQKIAGPADGRTRKRGYTAWGMAICLAWGGSAMMTGELIPLFFSLNQISGAQALGTLLGAAVVVIIFCAIGAGIGYVLALVADKVKGPID